MYFHTHRYLKNLVKNQPGAPNLLRFPASYPSFLKTQLSKLLSPNAWRLLLLSITAFTATVSLPTPAHAAAPTTEPKIGYVDMARALNEVEDGKVAKNKLKSDFESKQQKLDKMQTSLKAKKEAFDKSSSIMKSDVRQAKQNEIQQEFLDLQKTYMQLQQELIDSESHITQEIGRKLRTVIEKVGDRDTYLLILNIGDTVLYNKRHMDLTDEIVREYNKQFGKK